MYEFLEYCVEDAMTTDVITTDPETSLASVETLFDEHDFNSLPVLNASGELVGLLTKLDFLKAFRDGDEHMFPPYSEIMQRPVREVMTRDLRTVTPRARLTKVLEILIATGTKSLPVLDGTELVGIISREDVMRSLRRAAEEKRPEKLL